MKGQRYRQSYGNLYDELLEEKSMKNHKSTLDCRKSNTTPISYMWESSIPGTWIDIAGKNRFINRNAHTKRNTLQFLEETQKYINKICKPVFPDLNSKASKIPPKVSKRDSGEIVFMTEIEERKLSTNFTNEGLKKLLKKSNSNLLGDYDKGMNKRKIKVRNSSIDTFLNRFEGGITSPEGFDEVLLASKISLPLKNSQPKQISLRKNLLKIGAKMRTERRG